MNPKKLIAKKIAFYDSGIGGLTVLREFIATNPNVAEIIYIADTAYMPYGLKSAELIAERMEKVATFLQKQGCEAIVLACHTASAVWLEKRPDMILPIVDAINPTAEHILLHYPNNNVIVFATQLTIATRVYQKFLSSIHNGIFIASKALAQQIEMGKKATLSELIRVIGNSQRKTVVALACTHFLFAEQEIQKEIAKHYTSTIANHNENQTLNPIEIFDPAKAIAIQAKEQLIAEKSESKQNLLISVYSTGNISDNFITKVYATLDSQQISFYSPLPL